MPSFVRKLLGGGRPSASPVVPRQAPAASSKAADPGAAAGFKERVGRSRNKTVHTNMLGVSAGDKSGLSRKYLTGA